MLEFNLDEIIEPEIRNVPLYPWAELYPSLSRKPIRLSFSTFNLIHSCERKYHLLKNKDLTAYELKRESKHNNVHLDFGSALGMGIQSLILSQDVERSIFTSLLSYNFSEETKAKNSLSIVSSLQAFEAKWPAEDWEIVYYKGKPAAELSFKVILDRERQDYYCGYIDVVIRHKTEKTAVIVEVKTTGSKAQDLKPMFQNSAQGIGYSVILDAIEEVAGFDASWTILYVVVQFTGQNIIPKIHMMPFNKQAKARLEWLLDIRIDYEQLIRLTELNYWPKRGGSCFSYFRACPLLGLCDLETIAQGEEARIEREEDWDFVFYLDELIAKELQRT